jgi:hypothetical protein
MGIDNCDRNGRSTWLALIKGYSVSHKPSGLQLLLKGI